MSRHSVSFYICAAFLAVFGFIGLSSYDASAAKIEIGMAVLVLAAGLFLHSGAPNGRTVGMVALGIVIAYGVWQLVQGGYVPGTIVAGFALYRLAVGTSSAGGAPVGYTQGYPQQPYPQQATGQALYGQPQQIYYGQQPLGQPAPFGAQPSPYGGMPAPAAPPAPQPGSPPPTYDPFARPPGS